MEQRIGFIGLGSMGNAILKGILAKRYIPETQLYIYDADTQTAESLQSLYGVNYLDSAKQVAKESDIVIIAVKSSDLNEVLNDIQRELKKTTIVISVVPGININTITNSIGYEQKIVRAMLNTPALVSAAMTSITPNTEVTEEELEGIQSLFNCIGETAVIPENQIDAVMGVSGSSPAFVFMFIEALADGAVKGGLSRSQAYKFAAQSVMGSARLMLESGTHPAELKDMVCTAAGTAIDGVQVLEDKGFRSAVINAVVASITKSQNITE